MEKKKKIKKPLIDKFAIAFLVLSIICCIVGSIPLLSVIAMIFFYLMVFIVIIVTLLTILLNENFKAMLSSSEETFNNIAELSKYSPYMLSVAAGFSIIATILFATSKTISNKGGKITASVIFTILPIVIIILMNFSSK